MKNTRRKATEVKRSSMNLYSMSDKVIAGMDKLSKDSGIAKWLIVEKILENSLKRNTKFDVKKWLKAI